MTGLLPVGKGIATLSWAAAAAADDDEAIRGPLAEAVADRAPDEHAAGKFKARPFTPGRRNSCATAMAGRQVERRSREGRVAVGMLSSYALPALLFGTFLN